jgi:outer membrane protein
MERRNATLYKANRGKALALAVAALCAQNAVGQQPASPAAPAAAAQPASPVLTLQQAEMMALQNEPQIQAAMNEAAYANQQIVENNAANFPVVTAELTASGTNQYARIGAGYLTSSRMFNRYGNGFTFSQLITDLGRTHNLVASARLAAQAGNQNVQATRYDVLLQVNQAYFEVLRSQALIRTAQQTIDQRQTLLTQITELAKNKLRSDLDVNFAAVNLSQAKLLLIRAQNDLDASYAELARAVGANQITRYQVQDESLFPAPPADAEGLVTEAMMNRPELASLRFSQESATKFAEAEKDLARPTVNAVAVAGYTPYLDNVSNIGVPPEYAGAALNVSIPIFNGHLFTARRVAAEDRAMEANQNLRNEQLRLTRDVRLAWANASTAFQRIDVTAQFVEEAKLALKLAQGRYDLGLGSIVELSQAQLNETDAEIENLNAKYDYQTQYQQLQYAMGTLR